MAVRRLDEAETLASRSELTPGAEAQLRASFHQAASDLQTNLAALPPEKTFAAGNINNNFKSALKAHGRILTNINQNRQNKPRVIGDDDLAGLIAGVKQEQDVVDRDEIAVIKRSKSKESKEGGERNDQPTFRAATGARMVAQEKIAEVERLLDGQKSGLSSENNKKLDQRLHSVLEQLTAGQASLVNGQSEEALNAFQTASGLAEETNILIKAQEKLKDKDIDLGL